jgi:hypothetical protein
MSTRTKGLEKTINFVHYTSFLNISFIFSAFDFPSLHEKKKIKTSRKGIFFIVILKTNTTISKRKRGFV